MLQVHEKKILYFFFGVLAILAFIIVLITYPSVRQIRQINGEIMELRQQLELKYARSRRLNQSLAGLVAAQQIVNKNQLIYIVHGDESDFLDSLEKMAKELSLDQEISLDSKENPVNEEFYYLNLDLRLTGEFSRLMTYLNKLEKMNVIVSMTDLHLTGSSVSITIKSRVYVKNQS